MWSAADFSEHVRLKQCIHELTSHPEITSTKTESCTPYTSQTTLRGVSANMAEDWIGIILNNGDFIQKWSPVSTPTVTWRSHIICWHAVNYNWRLGDFGITLHWYNFTCISIRVMSLVTVWVSAQWQISNNITRKYWSQLTMGGKPLTKLKVTAKSVIYTYTL